MGKIQGAINGTLGTVAGAILAGKHASEAKAKQEEQGEFAKQEYHEASAELTKLEGQSAAAEETLKSANEAVEATKG